jgi:hypothetical protein
MSLIAEDMDDYENSNAVSECCHASILGEVVDDLGICSQCREWSGVVWVHEEEEEE